MCNMFVFQLYFSEIKTKLNIYIKLLFLTYIFFLIKKINIFINVNNKNKISITTLTRNRLVFSAIYVALHKNYAFLK